jgi:hypothetical protein
VTKRERLPRSEWAVLIEDHHPGYISWQEFLENEQRLSANRPRAGQRPPREGSALCQGIVRCGGCGRLMSTQYNPSGPRYDCYRGKVNWIKTAGCRSVLAATVDQLVARRLLQALAPEEIALALAAADEHQDRRARSDRALQLRVERARYQAIRAERAFHACEPDNRLVARSLEDRWEQKLRELKDAEAELAEHVVPSSEPSREQIEALARDLPALWAANSTAHRDRKRLLRALIADVTLTSDRHEPEVRVGIRWQSGAAEEHTIERPKTRAEVTRTPPQAVELIRQLAAEHTNAQIAELLNAAGLRTGHGHPFTARSVHWLRWAHKIPSPTTWAHDSELTVRQIAERFGVSTGTVYDWISTRKLTARRGPDSRLYVPLPPEVEQQCRQRIARSSHIPQTKTTTGTAAV